jgi:DNA 3'-phosphatase
MSDWPKNRRTLILPKQFKDSFGKNVCVAFFDADQTLRTSKSGKPSPHGAKDTEIFKHCTAKLFETAQKNYLLAIVSNQAGIKLGFITVGEVIESMHATIEYFASQGVFFNYYDFAENYDDHRKPNTGMALLLEHKLKESGLTLDWNNSFMVGDAAYKRKVDIQPNGQPGTDHSNTDRLFAENIAKTHKGFKFYHPREFFGAPDTTKRGQKR